MDKLTPLERELLEVLERADEELRLIRWKDTNAVYDVTLRIDMTEIIEQARMKSNG